MSVTYILQYNNDLIVLDLNSLKFLVASKSGIVYTINKGRIVKEYYREDDIDVKRQVFTRLGLHTNIVRHLGTTGNSSLILKRRQLL